MTYWLTSTDEPQRKTKIGNTLRNNPLYSAMNILRISPVVHRRFVNQSSNTTPHSYRNSPVALAPTWERNNSLRGSINRSNHNSRDFAKENGYGGESDPLMIS